MNITIKELKECVAEAIMKLGACFMIVLLYQIIAHNINIEYCWYTAVTICAFIEISKKE